MKEFKYKGVTYRVGDKVLLVNKIRTHWNGERLMDKYLGKVVTISDIYESMFGDTIFEIAENNPKKDGWNCKWKFYPEDIVKKVSKGTFFKKLPNDFTGTIDVVNGYINEPQILDEEEKRYLEGVIRPFRDEVTSIEKMVRCDGEYIIINMFGSCILLPAFEEGTMYRGMEVDRKYTLKELGLFEEE